MEGKVIEQFYLSVVSKRGYFLSSKSLKAVPL